MNAARRGTIFALLLAVAALLLAGSAPPAQAAKGKSTENEAEFLGFDAEAKTVTVKIRKQGKGPNRKLLKKNQKVTFKVKPEGSVLTRTTVKINGMKSELTDLPEGKRIRIRWVPDDTEEGAFFARGIDAVMSEEEFEAKYGKE
ncbi:MAG: hypothetical protein QNK03_17415 [Myxococcota bacterium]|nr:hypothetical protein [Myxococcota bacterium]